MRSSAAFSSSLALHLLLGLVILRYAPQPARPVLPLSPPPKIAVFVPPVDDETFPGLKPVETLPEDALADAAHEPPITLDRFTFNVAKVADRAHVLFPFLTPGLSWDHLPLVPEADRLQSLENPLARRRSLEQLAAVNRALVLEESTLQAIVDKSWSRRDRWSVFQPIVSLADNHSADAGDLPALLQRYRQQNALQPYEDTSIRDPRLWAELELAADHVKFIGFLRRYASERGSSKATTELLFLLDNLAESSQNILDTLLTIDPPQHLARTRQESRVAYDLVVELQSFYKDQLAQRGLTSAAAINAFYDDVRLRILMGIVNTTPRGYRANDARFLIGRIYWNQQRPDEALRWWRQLVTDPTDSHAWTYAQIIGLLQSPPKSPGDSAARDARLNSQIKAIMSRHYMRWIGTSFDRLWKFGYRFNTY